MAPKLPWFPFYGRDFFFDETVQFFSPAQIGIYLFLLWHQWEHESIPSSKECQRFPLFSHQGFNEQELEAVHTRCFQPHRDDQKRFYNPRLETIRLEQCEKELIRQERARKGGFAKSAASRIKQTLSSAQAVLNPANQSQSQSQSQNEEEERKKSIVRLEQTPTRTTPSSEGVNSRHYREEAKQLLLFLNAKTGKKFREVDANLRLIESRLKTGVDLQTCKSLIARKVRDWGADPKMQCYLRPETLFNKTKFEAYLAEVSQ